MSVAGHDELEEQIARWRAFVVRRAEIARDADELEAHLRDRIDVLSASGLADDEAFLVAVKRMGRLDELSREFAREHSERLWKQLLVDDRAPASRSRGLVPAILLAVGAAVAVRLATALSPDDGLVVLRNLGVLVLPFLATFFLLRRRSRLRTVAAVAAPFALAAVVLNAYPFAAGGMTEALSAAHAIVALWIVTGLAYADGDGRSSRARMDFVRFSGEWAVYYALIALGGAVLAGLTLAVFSTIGLSAQPFVSDWLVPCGAAGAVVIAAWLVEAKQSVVENIAPVLTRLFTPLFTALLLALVAAWIVQATDAGGGALAVFGQRDLLIVFDVVVIVVLALLLYSLSARDPGARPGWFDRLQVLMLASALVVDLLVLLAMVGRVAEYGASANKLASLGLNLVLLVNLAGATWLQTRFVLGRAGFARLERWQTAFLPVYLAWAAVVAAAFPVLFRYA